MYARQVHSLRSVIEFDTVNSVRLLLDTRHCLLRLTRQSSRATAQTRGLGLRSQRTLPTPGTLPLMCVVHP
jgi:hypothetical protein